MATPNQNSQVSRHVHRRKGASQCSTLIRRHFRPRLERPWWHAGQDDQITAIAIYTHVDIMYPTNLRNRCTQCSFHLNRETLWQVVECLHGAQKEFRNNPSHLDQLMLDDLQVCHNVCVCACIESPSNPKLQPTKLTPFQTISGFNYIVYI